MFMLCGVVTNCVFLYFRLCYQSSFVIVIIQNNMVFLSLLGELSIILLFWKFHCQVQISKLVTTINDY